MPSKYQSRPQGAQLPGTKGYEQRDANAKWIFGVVAFLFISGLAIHFILGGFLGSLKKTSAPSDAWRPLPRGTNNSESSRTFPRLQVSPPRDLAAFRAREDQELQAYGWVNRSSGIVRIPVERAIELVLQEGLPVRKGTNQDRTGPSSYQLMQQRPFQQQPEIKERP